MKKLKLLFLLFCLLISLPLGFVLLQTYIGIEREERTQMQYFGEALFDRMEEELAALVQQEESRGVDEYTNSLATSVEPTKGGASPSPLAQPGDNEFILGYLQNNPDGSFQTPIVADMGSVPEDLRSTVTQLKQANSLFNEKKLTSTASKDEETLPPEKVMEEKNLQLKNSLSARYLKKTKRDDREQYLGKQKSRVEEITLEQAYTIAGDDQTVQQYQQMAEPPVAAPQTDSFQQRRAVPAMSSQSPQEELFIEKEDDGATRFQVEVAPFQAVSLTNNLLYVFRRIIIGNQIYRQGLVVKIDKLMVHLVENHFSKQPLAQYSLLTFNRVDGNGVGQVYSKGVELNQVKFSASRTFPPPFEMLAVTLKAKEIPVSSVRAPLNGAVILLSLFLVAGLVAIYKSVQSIVALSERRAQFVSSVSHELKTPLTNIRMYVEMLQQGMATTPEKEESYFEVLTTESTRLSGLINNVLELSRLERKTRQFSMAPGTLEDVFAEVATLMHEKLSRDGFTLTVNPPKVVEFSYDREVLVQILVNLIENSHKFGKDAAEKCITVSAADHSTEVVLQVSDTGPGIPKNHLKKIFDDFYRVDNGLTSEAGGTGIGLALVKKFVVAMGGEVAASNNKKSGCTISIVLPMS